jgi:hypothetical protein
MRIDLTTGMSAEEIAPLWPAILACFEKYVARFPDETVENMVAQIMSGRRQLWVVRDDEGNVVLAPISEIVTVDATGKKRLVCAEIGGERLQEAVHLIGEMEAWAAREHGATESELVGRVGWGKLLQPLGYELAAQIYRKALR